MPDFKKMTVESLRELARKVLGPGHSKLKKSELVRALEEASGKAAPARGAGTRARAAGTRAVEATGRAVEVAKQAGKAAREGVRAVARAGKAAAEAAVEGARAGAKVARERKGAKGGRAAKAAVAAAGPVAEGAPHAKKARAERPSGGPDPEGYFVARVRGEDAVREAPHAMAESGSDTPYRSFREAVGAPAFEESLGELPWSYGDDAFVALPRDPRTLFVYWDHARETIGRAFEGLEHGRAQLWVFARGALGWERVRTIDFALESRGWYVHDLDPGRTYRAEIHAVDAHGRDRLLHAASNEVALPPVGPSSIVDDRFVRIPWDLPLGRVLGPGHAGPPFPDEARAMLARLSDWARFAGTATWGGSAGGMGGRTSSPTSAPSSPTSPARPWGEGGER